MRGFQSFVIGEKTMLSVKEVKSIYHVVEEITLIQSCPKCGKEHATISHFVRFTFNDPRGVVYVLGREREKPLMCCGKEITLLASFDDEASADAAMHGYADLCVALDHASSSSSNCSIETVIPFYLLKEVLSRVRNPP